MYTSKEKAAEYLGRHNTQYVEDNKEDARHIGENGSDKGKEGVDRGQHGEGNRQDLTREAMDKATPLNWGIETM